MKKNSIIIISIIFIVTVFFIINESSFAQEQEVRDLFAEIRKSYSEKLPDDFVANIESRQMEKELEEVPDFEKINPEEPFTISFLYLKDFGERIVVNNACSLTRNMFKNYLEVYQSFRSFLDPNVTAESFFRQYRWEIVNNNPRFYVIKMETRGITNQYYQIYIDKANMLLARTFFFKDGSENGRVDIEYTRLRNYLVPSYIKGYSFITNENNRIEKKEFEIKMNDFKINQNISVDDILGDKGIDC